jgi:hypothetical protein
MSVGKHPKSPSSHVTSRKISQEQLASWAVQNKTPTILQFRGSAEAAGLMS